MDELPIWIALLLETASIGPACHIIYSSHILQVTQLGHVKDLATAFVKVLGNTAATKQTYNISGERYVTFDGLVKACALATGGSEPEIVHYDPKAVDLGKAKAFPLRDQHFFTSIEKVKPHPLLDLCFLRAAYVHCQQASVSYNEMSTESIVTRKIYVRIIRG